MLQPVVVREVAPGRYELVMGERRWRALAGGRADDRAGDHPRHRRTTTCCATRCWRTCTASSSTRSRRPPPTSSCWTTSAAPTKSSPPDRPVAVPRLQHPPAAQPAAAVQRRVAAGCSQRRPCARAAGLDDPDAQERLAHRIVAEGLSVRAVEELVASARPGPRPASSTGRLARTLRRSSRWPAGCPTASRPGSRSSWAGPRARSPSSSPRSTTSSASWPRWHRGWRN